MKTIASSLGVARSHLVKQLAEPKANRPAAYLKTEDQFLLAKIEKICGHRPSYGYRRVCALINRERAFSGHARVNHKRIYRIMRSYSPESNGIS